MFFNKPFSDSQTQPCSLNTACLSLTDLVKLVENRFVLGFRNSNPSVSDTNLYKAGLLSYLDRHPASVRSEFHRITEKVVKDLLESKAIRVELDLPVGDTAIMPTGTDWTISRNTFGLNFSFVIIGWLPQDQHFKAHVQRIP